MPQYRLKSSACTRSTRRPANHRHKLMVSVIATPIRYLAHHAEVKGVVGHHQEIQRLFHLHHEARGMLDGRTLGELIGIVGRAPGAHQIGVERQDGVDVGIAEIGIAQRIGFDAWHCFWCRRRFAHRRRLRILAAGRQ